MNKYSVVKTVGQGSFGKALLCERRTDKRKCIIKEISLKKMSRKEAKQTQQEGTILARLNHPNITTFWETFNTPNAFYIVMEFADSGDLDNFIKKRNHKMLAENQVLHLFVQISLAIKHVHDRKILHRDLKTQNIFLTSAGIVKLGDFGIARVLTNTGELASTRIGTPYYMSPEVMDNKKYNNKTDIWSLGCILYELMALKVPFDGQSMRQLVYNIMYTQPGPLNKLFSTELKELCKEMLFKNPRQRPSVNGVLRKNVVRQRISTILNPAEVKDEFSHTILHGLDILKAKAVQQQQQQLGAGGAPSSAAAAAAGGACPPAGQGNVPRPQPAAPPAPPPAPAPAPAPAPRQTPPAARPMPPQPPQPPSQMGYRAPAARAAVPAAANRAYNIITGASKAPSSAAAAAAVGGPVRLGGGLKDLIERQKQQQSQLQQQLARLQQQCMQGNNIRRGAAAAAAPSTAASDAASIASARAQQQRNEDQAAQARAVRLKKQQEEYRAERLKQQQKMDAQAQLQLHQQRKKLAEQQAQQEYLDEQRRQQAHAMLEAQRREARAKKVAGYEKPWAQNMKPVDGAGEAIAAERALEKEYYKKMYAEANPRSNPNAAANKPPGAVRGAVQAGPPVHRDLARQQRQQPAAAGKAAVKPAWVGVLDEKDKRDDSDSSDEGGDLPPPPYEARPSQSPAAPDSNRDKLNAMLPPPPPASGAGAGGGAARESPKIASQQAGGGAAPAVGGGNWLNNVNSQMSDLQDKISRMKAASPVNVAAAGDAGFKSPVARASPAAAAAAPASASPSPVVTDAGRKVGGYGIISSDKLLAQNKASAAREAQKAELHELMRRQREALREQNQDGAGARRPPSAGGADSRRNTPISGTPTNNNGTGASSAAAVTPGAMDGMGVVGKGYSPLVGSGRKADGSSAAPAPTRRPVSGSGQRAKGGNNTPRSAAPSSARQAHAAKPAAPVKVLTAEEKAHQLKLKREEERKCLREMIQRKRMAVKGGEVQSKDEIAISAAAAARAAAMEALEADGVAVAEAEAEAGDEDADCNEQDEDELLERVEETERMRTQIVDLMMANAGMADDDENEEEDVEGGAEGADSRARAKLNVSAKLLLKHHIDEDDEGEGAGAGSPGNANASGDASESGNDDASEGAFAGVDGDEEAQTQYSEEYQKMLLEMHSVLDMPAKAAKKTRGGGRTSSSAAAAAVLGGDEGDASSDLTTTQSASDAASMASSGVDASAVTAQPPPEDVDGDEECDDDDCDDDDDSEFFEEESPSPSASEDDDEIIDDEDDGDFNSSKCSSAFDDDNEDECAAEDADGEGGEPDDAAADEPLDGSGRSEHDDDSSDSRGYVVVKPTGDASAAEERDMHGSTLFGQLQKTATVAKYAKQVRVSGPNSSSSDKSDNFSVNSKATTARMGAGAGAGHKSKSSLGPMGATAVLDSYDKIMSHQRNASQVSSLSNDADAEAETETETEDEMLQSPPASGVAVDYLSQTTTGTQLANISSSKRAIAKKRLELEVLEKRHELLVLFSERKLISACSMLRRINEVEDSDDAILGEVEKLLGVAGLEKLDDILELIRLQTKLEQM